MNAPMPAHLLPRLEPRPVPAAMIEALKTRFGDRCSTALAVREQHGRDAERRNRGEERSFEGLHGRA